MMEKRVKDIRPGDLMLVYRLNNGTDLRVFSQQKLARAKHIKKFLEENDARETIVLIVKHVRDSQRLYNKQVRELEKFYIQVKIGSLFITWVSVNEETMLDGDYVVDVLNSCSHKRCALVLEKELNRSSIGLFRLLLTTNIGTIIVTPMTAMQLSKENLVKKTVTSTHQK